MGKALYRKYRSKSLDEIVGQEHVTKTLSQALKQGRISHAYLFTGPRGVGKTSIARILAHEVNRLPYSDDTTHIDIIEIDAASNRRIDEIRDLRDKVHVAPAAAQYKVYIIDEVHMLTKEAFNALLKTLEEPPEHVIFILATTDAHKLPETIISRTQRFTFKPGEKQQVIDHLQSIAKKEKIAISPDALALLAEYGEGSFRDSVSLLDQASSHGEKLELEDVQRLLGIPPATAIEALVETLANGQPSELVIALETLFGQGFQAATIAKQLGQALRQQLIQGAQSLPSDTTMELLAELIAVPAAHNPERLLEIVLLRNLQATPEITVSQPAQSEPAPSPEPAAEAKLPEPEVETEPVVAKEEPTKPKRQPAATTAVLDEANWPEVLKTLKQRHNTLYGIVRMAQPDFSEPGVLTLQFGFAFHQKRLNEAGNRQKIADIIQEITGEHVSIECAVSKEVEAPALPEKSAQKQPPQNLAAISNIFGGAELLES